MFWGKKLKSQIVNKLMKKMQHLFCNSNDVSLLKRPEKFGKYLIFIRCGSQKPSIDLKSIKDKYNFDVLYSFYALPDFDCDDENVYISCGGMSKYQAFEKLWRENDFLRSYEAYWFVDNDINFQCADIVPFIEEGLNGNCLIWQPSLSNNSHSRWRHLYKIEGKVGLRNTNFVEVMAPAFSNLAVIKCIDTFSKSISTWGLDFAWSKIIVPSKMGVSDTYTMTHLDAPDTKNGPYYVYLKKNSINPYFELLKIRIAYGRLLFTPKTFIDKYISEWIKIIKQTDIDATRTYKFDEWYNFDKSVTSVCFLNHHSILTLANNGVIPSKKSLCYVDGIALKKQLGLNGDRLSFDFTGIAEYVFETCRRLNIGVGAIGGSPEEAEAFKEIIEKKYPGIEIYTSHGYMKSEDITKKAIVFAKTCNVRVLLLGLGSPLQELSMQNIERSSVNGLIVYTCGGFISQTSQSPNGKYYPDFYNKLNLRWLWRIFTARHVLKRLLTTYIKSFFVISRIKIHDKI